MCLAVSFIEGPCLLVYLFNFCFFTAILFFFFCGWNVVLFLCGNKCSSKLYSYIYSFPILSHKQIKQPKWFQIRWWTVKWLSRCESFSPLFLLFICHNRIKAICCSFRNNVNIFHSVFTPFEISLEERSWSRLLDPDKTLTVLICLLNVFIS